MLHAADRLHGLGAEASAITVSGLSSGGYMAVQFHVAHSAMVSGAGILAGGPYYCAHGSAWRAYYNCMRPSAFAPLPDLPSLHAATDDLARARRIDPVAGLAGDRVWLFSGSRDQTVLPEVVAALDGYYRRYVRPANLVLVRGVPAGHAMPSADPDITHDCAVSESPYLNRCVEKASGSRYDAAGALLVHLLGTAPPPRGGESGTLTSFDQREFADGAPYSISLADEGYVYVPAACRNQACRVHVAFHGCRQQAALVGAAFARDAGYNRWADAHRLIVLYPQTVARYGWWWDGSFVLNPTGCWDWWGYTGADYHTKSAPQIRAVQAMVKRLRQAQ